MGCACLLTWIAAPLPSSAAEDDIIVFAAASLKTVLDSVAATYGDIFGAAPTTSYAGTPLLARQIEQGAPADIVITADETWMDYLQQRGLVSGRIHRGLIGNRLVVIVPVGSGPAAHDLANLMTLLGADGRLALADTEAVPAGRYARQALENLGLWTALSGRMAESDSVRSALAFVARREAPAGIVYATDAAAEPNVVVVAEIPAASHAPIRYAAAITKDADPGAEKFFDYLVTPEAMSNFSAHGFVVPETGD